MLENVSDKKITVIGDLMLDKYISGYSERISPEAPVPVVKANDENIYLGGAGNVVANVASLGAAVYPIGIIGTETTIQSNVYEKKIHELCSKTQISSLATPLLVPMIEEGFIHGEISDTIISNYLSNKKLGSIQHLILACTHYPLIHKKIEKFYNYNINVINSSDIVVNYIEKELQIKNLLKKRVKKNYDFFASNYTKSLENSARFFFHETIKLRESNIWE